MKFSYIESQIELQDSLWQIFSEPEEITLMNIDRLSFIQLPIANEVGSFQTIWVDLSKEVKKEGRQVTSFPSLFGDISGLKDFFNFLIILTISGAQAKMYQFN